MSGDNANSTFCTNEIRAWSAPTLKNAKIVTTWYPGTHYPIGLTLFDYDRAYNLRIQSHFDAVKLSESDDTFTSRINLDSWADTVNYATGCTWLPVSTKDRDFSFGKVKMFPSQLTAKIKFDEGYTAAPKVVVWINGFDVDKNADWGFFADATKITSTGFTLKAEILGNTKLNHVELTWIAYPASRPNIDSGRFSTIEVRDPQKPRFEHSKAVAFGKAFDRAPRVYFALNRIDSTIKSNLRLKAHVTDITAKGMNVHLDSWFELNMKSAEGQWIAVQDHQEAPVPITPSPVAYTNTTAKNPAPSPVVGGNHWEWWLVTSWVVVAVTTWIGARRV